MVLRCKLKATAERRGFHVSKFPASAVLGPDWFLYVVAPNKNRASLRSLGALTVEGPKHFSDVVLTPTAEFPGKLGSVTAKGSHSVRRSGATWQMTGQSRSDQERDGEWKTVGGSRPEPGKRVAGGSH